MISDLARTAFVLPEREEESVDLGWVLKVFTESEMLRSGFADRESESLTGAGGVQTAKASRKQSSLSGKESAQGCQQNLISASLTQ